MAIDSKETIIKQQIIITGKESNIDGISILDLREVHQQDLLNAFIDLYDKTFTDPRERENMKGTSLEPYSGGGRLAGVVVLLYALWGVKRLRS